jgi:glycosyltransferase involved in cell wall biosynthesis
VVFVGRLGEEKRIDDLLNAWKRVVASASGTVQLELWGTGPLQAELKALCGILGIANSVIFRGHMESVRSRLEAMDVFVLTSVIEGNSNAILEAMAAGLPVVSTRVGGTPMLVGPDGARFLVEPGDRDGLYARLLEMIEDAKLRRRIGDAMYQRIVAHFDMRRVAGTYVAAYELLAAGRRDHMGEIGNPVITGP